MVDEPPGDENLGQLMLQAFWWLDRRAAYELERDGEPALPAAQALTLARIAAAGSRPADLARLLGVSRQAVHQTLNELEREGLVRRVRTPGTPVTVQTTAAGRRRARAVTSADAAAEQALADRLGADRLVELRRTLEADWGEPEDAA